MITPRDIFGEYLVDDPNLELYFEDSHSLIVGEAQRKKIEFDGYLQEHWEKSADSVYHFDEEYFEDKNRKKLYVYLSSIVDEEIYGYLRDALI